MDITQTAYIQKNVVGNAHTTYMKFKEVISTSESFTFLFIHLLSYLYIYGKSQNALNVL